MPRNQNWANAALRRNPGAACAGGGTGDRHPWTQRSRATMLVIGSAGALCDGREGGKAERACVPLGDD